MFGSDVLRTLLLAAFCAVSSNAQQSGFPTTGATPGVVNAHSAQELKSALQKKASRIHLMSNVTASQEVFPEVSLSCFHRDDISGVLACQANATTYEPYVRDPEALDISEEEAGAVWTAERDATFDVRFLERALLIGETVTLKRMRVAQLFDDRLPYAFFFATFGRGNLRFNESVLHSPCGGLSVTDFLSVILTAWPPSTTYSIDEVAGTLHFEYSERLRLVDSINAGTVELFNTTIQCYDEQDSPFADHEVPVSWAPGAATTIVNAGDACQRRATTGEDYRGVVNTTGEGHPCMNWNETDPHMHTRLPDRLPEYGLGASNEDSHNYCRNPDNTPIGVWCYIASEDPNLQDRRWAYCDVPFCEDLEEASAPGPASAPMISDPKPLPTPEHATSSSKVHPAILAAIIAGASAAIACAVVGFCVLWRRSRRRELPESVRSSGRGSAPKDNAPSDGGHPTVPFSESRSPDLITMTGWGDNDESIGIAMVAPPSTRPAHRSERSTPSLRAPRDNELITMTLWSGNAETMIYGAGSVTATRSGVQDAMTTSTPHTDAGSFQNRVCIVEALENALDEMYTQQQLLAGRWQVLNAAHRRCGGQGVVQFVKDTTRRGQDMVVKFFLHDACFEREAELYAMPAVREMMPAVVALRDNRDGALKACNGCVLPAFIVLEKGRSLNEWALITRPDYATCLQVLVQIVERLVRLHECGIVHRDVKPANILWRPDVGRWTLIDFGCAVAQGQDASVACSLPYAAPEVAQALKMKQLTMKADTSLDVWALGVVIYELLIGDRVFSGCSGNDIIDALTSPDTLPWEGANLSDDRVRKLGLVKRIIKRCLSRDPAQRPTAETLLGTMDSLFRSATSTTHVEEP